MRYLELDFLRGLAIVLMVFFHISFDLNNFHFIDINIYHGKNWFYFRMVIVTLFMLSVGISLSLTHKKGVDFQKAFKRFYVLAGASLAVTIASFITFPNSWIYFGVLHFVAIASVVALAVIKHEWIALVLGVAIVVLFNLRLIDMHWLFIYLQPLLHLPKHTEDLVPFTPWLGVVFIGIFIGKKELFLFPLQKNSVTKFIGALGRHSLLIYLTHQPLFFGIIAGAHFLLH